LARREIFVRTDTLFFSARMFAEAENITGIYKVTVYIETFAREKVNIRRLPQQAQKTNLFASEKVLKGDFRFGAAKVFF
jgi:hypothetical protein